MSSNSLNHTFFSLPLRPSSSPCLSSVHSLISPRPRPLISTRPAYRKQMTFNKSRSRFGIALILPFQGLGSNMKAFLCHFNPMAKTQVRLESGRTAGGRAADPHTVLSFPLGHPRSSFSQAQTLVDWFIGLSESSFKIISVPHLRQLLISVSGPVTLLLLLQLFR